MSGKRLGLLAATAAMVMTAFGVGSAAAAPSPQVISLLEMDTTFVGTGGWNTAANEPPSIGQGFVTDGTYFKWAGKKRGAAVGHLQVTCTTTTPVTFTQTGATGWFHCEATAFLPGGRIEASGALSFSAGTNTLSIVGGTGRYLSAQGSVATTNIGGEDSSSSSDVFHITN